MIITLFESVQKAYTRHEQIISDSWPNIADFLTTHQPANHKEEVPLFNLWQFKTENYQLGRKYIYNGNERTDNYNELPNTIRRCKENAIGSWGIVLDYDGSEKIENAIEKLEELEFILYTTFRHTKEKHKFRIVLPFRDILGREEFRQKKKSIAETFVNVDHASFSESQSFYLHSGKNPFIHKNSGIMLDGHWFDNEIIIPPTRVSSTFTGDKSYYRQTLSKSLLSCNNLHYSGINSYGVLTLVALCKSAEMDYLQYDFICKSIAASDSSLQNQSTRKQAWVNWNVSNGISAAVREEFIKQHGGVSAFYQNPRSMNIDDLKKKLNFLLKKE